MQDMAGGTEIGVTLTAPVYVDEKMNGDATSVFPMEGEEPSENERQTLRHVSDKLPWSAFLVALVELCERFAYYGLSGPFQNYIQVDPSPKLEPRVWLTQPQNPYKDPSGVPGAIGEFNIEYMES